tara:strand:+ start:24579 stop:27746 length:3168 start_codon:yes stop_codon:yes gene_type:complete
MGVVEENRTSGLLAGIRYLLDSGSSEENGVLNTLDRVLEQDVVPSEISLARTAQAEGDYPNAYHQFSKLMSSDDPHTESLARDGLTSLAEHMLAQPDEMSLMIRDLVEFPQQVAAETSLGFAETERSREVLRQVYENYRDSNTLPTSPFPFLQVMTGDEMAKWADAYEHTPVGEGINGIGYAATLWLEQRNERGWREAQRITNDSIEQTKRIATEPNKSVFGDLLYLGIPLFNPTEKPFITPYTNDDFDSVGHDTVRDVLGDVVPNLLDWEIEQRRKYIDDIVEDPSLVREYPQGSQNYLLAKMLEDKRADLPFMEGLDFSQQLDDIYNLMVEEAWVHFKSLRPEHAASILYHLDTDETHDIAVEMADIELAGKNNPLLGLTREELEEYGSVDDGLFRSPHIGFADFFQHQQRAFLLMRASKSVDVVDRLIHIAMTIHREGDFGLQDYIELIREHDKYAESPAVESFAGYLADQGIHRFRQGFKVIEDVYARTQDQGLKQRIAEGTKSYVLDLEKARGTGDITRVQSLGMIKRTFSADEISRMVSYFGDNVADSVDQTLDRFDPNREYEEREVNQQIWDAILYPHEADVVLGGVTQQFKDQLYRGATTLSENSSDLHRLAATRSLLYLRQNTQHFDFVSYSAEDLDNSLSDLIIGLISDGKMHMLEDFVKDLGIDQRVVSNYAMQGLVTIADDLDERISIETRDGTKISIETSRPAYGLFNDITFVADYTDPGTGDQVRKFIKILEDEDRAILERLDPNVETVIGRVVVAGALDQEYVPLADILKARVDVNQKYSEITHQGETYFVDVEQVLLASIDEMVRINGSVETRLEELDPAVADDIRSKLPVVQEMDEGIITSAYEALGVNTQSQAWKTMYGVKEEQGPHNITQVTDGNIGNMMVNPVTGEVKKVDFGIIWQDEAYKDFVIQVLSHDHFSEKERESALNKFSEHYGGLPSEPLQAILEMERQMFGVGIYLKRGEVDTAWIRYEKARGAIQDQFEDVHNEMDVGKEVFLREGRKAYVPSRINTTSTIQNGGITYQATPRKHDIGEVDRISS